MKKILAVLLVWLLIFSCRKDEEIDPTRWSKFINNDLISGSDCVSFQREIGGPLGENINSVIEISDGFLLAGYTKSLSKNEVDGLLIKTDCFGDTLWVKTFDIDNSDIVYSVLEHSNGSFYLTGITRDSYQPQKNQFAYVFVIKVSENGSEEWRITDYSFGGQTQVFSSISSSDGRIFIRGDDSYQYSSFILCIDENGNEVYRIHETALAPEFEWYKKIMDFDLNSNNDLIVVGSSGGAVIGGNSDEYYNYITKINTQGDTIWRKELEYQDWNLFISNMVILDNDELIVTGIAYYPNSTDNFIARLTPDADLLWYISIHDIINSPAQEMMLNSDGNVSLFSSSNNTTSILKLDPIDGAKVFSNSKHNSNYSYGSGITTSDNGYLTVVNSSNSALVTKLNSIGE